MGKIRIATKNFLCEKCNQLIKSGDSYYDWWNVTVDNTYYHRRFHMDCVEKNMKNTRSEKSKKPSLLERLQKKLDDENGCLVMAYNGEKCYVCGIRYDEGGDRKILCETWNERTPYYESLENFKWYHDYKGDYI